MQIFQWNIAYVLNMCYILFVIVVFNCKRMGFSMMNYKCYTVLYVDDDPQDLFLLGEVLKPEINMIVTTDPEEALCLIKEREIAVLISDQRMPHMNGEELLFRAKNIVPDIVTVMITAYSDFAGAIKSVNEAQMYRYINKEAGSEEKKQHIKQAIEAYHKNMEMKRLRNYLYEYTEATVVEMRPEHDRTLKPANFIEPYDVSVFHDTLAYFLAFESKVCHEIKKPEKQHMDIDNLETEREGVDRYDMDYHMIGDIAVIRNMLTPYFTEEELKTLFYGKLLTREYLDSALERAKDKTGNCVDLREKILEAKVTLGQIALYTPMCAVVVQQQPGSIVYQVIKKEPEDKIVLRHNQYIEGDRLICQQDGNGDYTAFLENGGEAFTSADDFFFALLDILYTA